jgi:hypothetical protein
MSPTRPFSLLSFIAAIIFAVAHTQPALYYSNQNQYFLHGLANAGMGNLASDWLAQTQDPTPLFSLGIQLGYQLGTWTYHAAFIGLLMLYFLSLWAMVLKCHFAPQKPSGQLLLSSLIIVSHSGVLRSLSVWLTGVDYPWYFQAGVANQYLLGAGLQPSVFGVLLLTALAFYVYDRPLLSSVCVALACGCHATYLLPGALLILGIMWNECSRNRYRSALFTGVLALLLVLPTLYYVKTTFHHTNEKDYQEAISIIAWKRIPHHCDPKRWLDWVAWLQFLWCGLGVLLLWRTSLFRPVLLASVVGAALTVVLSFNESAGLALLFPWRISAVLVPICTVIVLSRIAQFLEGIAKPAWLIVLALALYTATLVGTAILTQQSLAYQTNSLEDELLRVIRDTRKPGDVYLIPAKFPKPTTSKGTSSASFVPLSKSSSAVFELQRFRLETGAAIYVDFKSIPYQHDEVLEWHRRVLQVEKWYSTSNWMKSNVVNELRQQSITHIVLTKPHNIQLPDSELLLIAQNELFAIYQILATH